MYHCALDPGWRGGRRAWRGGECSAVLLYRVCRGNKRESAKRRECAATAGWFGSGHDFVSE